MRRQLAAGYFLLQAAAVAAWWALLATAPAVRLLFAVRDAPFVVLAAFAPGDLAGIAVGSLVIAWRRERPWAGPLAWLVAGAMAYAAVYTVTTAILRVSAPWGALLMVPAAGASLAAAAALSRHAPADTLPRRPVA